MSEILLPSQEEQILAKGLVYDDIVLTSGTHSTVKFEFDNIDDISSEFSLIVSGLTTIIEQRYAHAEAIITVATGANRLAQPLSEELGIPSIQTTKLGRGVFTMSPRHDPDMNAVLVDDVYTSGASLGTVSRLAMKDGFFVLGGVVILDRSDKEVASIEYGNISRPVRSLIKRQLETE